MTEIPILSQAAELISAGISFGQGDFRGGLIGLGSMIPVGGKIFEGMKVARGIGKIGTKAANGVSKSFKGVTESFLKNNGIKDIHLFKADWLGTNKNLKLFDVVKNTSTKEIMIIRKETQEIIVNTKIIAQ